MLQKYNKTLPSWASLLVFDALATPFIILGLFVGLRDSDATDSGFGALIWVPFVSGLIALIGITHYVYVKRHLSKTTKRTLLEIGFLACTMPFLLLLLLLVFAFLR